MGYSRANRRRINDAETRLRFEVRPRELGVRFRRQYIIGPYIVDLVCLAMKRVVEVAGHGISIRGPIGFGTNTGFRGYRVVRVSSWDVLRDIEGVLTEIVNARFPEEETVQ